MAKLQNVRGHSNITLHSGGGGVDEVSPSHFLLFEMLFLMLLGVKRLQKNTFFLISISKQFRTKKS
jgi:hypothetical protein